MLQLFYVGLPGFEPRQTEPKSVVLPLYYRPMSLAGFYPTKHLRSWGSKNKVLRQMNQNFLQFTIGYLLWLLVL